MFLPLVERATIFTVVMDFLIGSLNLFIVYHHTKKAAPIFLGAALLYNYGEYRNLISSRSQIQSELQQPRDRLNPYRRLSVRWGQFQ